LKPSILVAQLRNLRLLNVSRLLPKGIKSNRVVGFLHAILYHYAKRTTHRREKIAVGLENIPFGILGSIFEAVLFILGQ
jgi:hypothetical protein